MVGFPIDDPQGAMYLYIVMSHKVLYQFELTFLFYCRKYRFNMFESRYASHLWEMTIMTYIIVRLMKPI